MIKRSESKTKCSRRKLLSRKKNRRSAFESLERRELLAVNFTGDFDLPTFNSPRNVGTVQSFQFIESERLNENGQNDFISNADFVPLGTGPGQQDTIDVQGRMQYQVFPNDPLSVITDIDTFAFDLRAGDILDISTLGAAGTIDLFYENGTLWQATEQNQAVGYPPDSPLQTFGNVISAQVVPEDGRYYLSVTPIDTSAAYTLGLRVYRPSAESLPIGFGQALFLDFDGGFIAASDLGGLQPGLLRIPPLSESLPLLGVELGDTAAENLIIDRIVEEVEFHFDTVTRNGGNGDFVNSGVPGEYGIRILNSRDDPDPVGNPLVSRVLIGGSIENIENILGVPVNGVSTTLDVGNFSMDDNTLVNVEGPFLEAATALISPTESLLTAAAVRAASTVSHEAAHSFGLRHTDNENTIGNIIDAGGTQQVVDQRLGIGPDGIFGTLDDTRIEFRNDFYLPDEGYIGVSRVPDALAFTLATGTVGTPITGTVFNDQNRDGSNAGDPGLEGVLVFADSNGNQVLDDFEQSSFSSATGGFSLSVASSDVTVIAITPTGFTATTPTAVPGSTPGISFGFSEDNPASTGVVFADSNGNGFRDPGDDGLEGFFVYLDLNGNDVIDLGEPKAVSTEDGTYRINFPGPGPFTIRVVGQPGFELTTPPTGEYTNGTPDGLNYDFGFLPSFDYGDAPGYGTLDTPDFEGAKHGITDGLRIGALIDRELNGQPNADATGDDITDLADEDGVRLDPTTPLGLDAPATFIVNVTNTTGISGFIHGFIDLNIDGDFDDAGETLAPVTVASGTIAADVEVPVFIPPTAVVGDTFVRFRLSQTPVLGPDGVAEAGEVEDHTFPILPEAKVANNDTETVPRNSTREIFVLDNDFQSALNPLVVSNLILNGVDDTGRQFSTEGSVRIASDRGSVFYTPPNGFIGLDKFGYEVTDSFGNTDIAFVTVNVVFQTEEPIAIDDIFSVPEGSSDRALNVLDNDVSSIFGGISITSVTRGDNGGTVRIVGGGQSLRYTPAPGFNGTEQFTYSIQDSEGQFDSATVTVNLLPGSLFDDRVEFTVGIFDPVNTNRELPDVQVGDEFLARIFVEDIDPSRGFVAPKGVASAFLDFLYTDELATIVSTPFGPDITFGPLFSGGGSAQNGNVDTPGLIDEIGSVQPITDVMDHFDRTELFTVRMRAVSPGVAVFQSDPADLLDSPQSETILIDEDDALEVSEQRFGQIELPIFPESNNFSSAIDDSFPESIDTAFPSDQILDVLANDNLGDTGTIRQFDLLTGATLGTATIDRGPDPFDFTDDRVVYRPFQDSNGLERFTYLLVTDDGVRSTAEVTISLGNQAANADVFYEFSLVSGTGSGAPIDPSLVGIGDRIGIQVTAEDTRFTPTYVFAGFLDVLYNKEILQPADTDPSDAFDFDIQFGENYVQDPDIDATAFRPGIIDEVGTFSTAIGSDPSINGSELFTVFFNVVGNGTARLVGSPADATPFSDTLLFNEDDPIPVSDIRYDVLEFFIGPQQNGRLRQDVNNDNFVTPVDALLVINQLSRGLAEGEAAGGSSGSQFKYYTDVNGDNQVTAIDALQVINYLVRGGNGASGEQLTGPIVAPSSSADSDEVISDLSGDAKIIGGVEGGIATGPGVNLTGSEFGSDDDDEDLMTLLADDVNGQWS